MSEPVEVAEPYVVPPDEACVIPHVEPVRAEYGLLCRRHWAWVLNTLREVEELWSLRGHVLLPGPGSDVRVATSRDGSPAPGRVGVMALSDARNSAPLAPDDVPDVPGVLLGWWRVIEEELPIRNAPDRITVVGIIHALRQYRAWISRQPWVDDYAAELHGLHRALAGATGAGMWPASIGKCPTCGRPLHITVGVDEISCRTCGSAWAGVAIARLNLMIQQQEEGA